MPPMISSHMSPSKRQHLPTRRHMGTHGKEGGLHRETKKQRGTKNQEIAEQEPATKTKEGHRATGRRCDEHRRSPTGSPLHLSRDWSCDPSATIPSSQQRNTSNADRQSEDTITLHNTTSTSTNISAPSNVRNKRRRTMVDQKAAEKYGLDGGENGTASNVTMNGHAHANEQMDVQDEANIIYPGQITQQFLAANDEDTRNVMNAMSSKSDDDLKDLKFYCVPAAWFVKAYPMLTDRSGATMSDSALASSSAAAWFEQIGTIPTHELRHDVAAGSNGESDGNDNDNDNGNGNGNGNDNDVVDDSEHKDGSAEAKTDSSFAPSMKPGLVHGKDFFILGQNSWKVINEHFTTEPDEGGSQHVFERPCYFLSSHSVDIAVRLYDTKANPDGKTFELIPQAGRFKFETMLNDTNASSDSTRGAAEALANVDDDSTGAESGDLNITIIRWEPSNTNNEDDDDDDDDVKQSNHGPANPPSDGEPLLLLPPSTSANAVAAAAAAVASRKNTMNGDDMDAESTKSQNSEEKSPTQSAGRKRFASGLGNLGNTCFMNSSLQCLAHTEPLRQYFLSGEYRNELNRDNPLGTGGELAIQFAKLLSNMWGVPSKRRNVMGTSFDYSNSNGGGAVYPRNFKETLGRHAEQFMGYDQHDSQELATYLLDALHEDTNKVTKKPYIEKPEQGEDESDDEAAAKAWSLHLKREDSKVLENFMGQVKSRVQCCEEGCNRVSTTFDPFMYLGVPIPGTTNMTIDLTFVPLDPDRRMFDLSITLNKNATMKVLLKMVAAEVVRIGACAEDLSIDDLMASDVFHNEIYSTWKPTDHIDAIKDTDTVFVFQLEPLEEIRRISEEAAKKATAEQSAEVLKWKEQESRSARYKLDIATMRNMTFTKEWQFELEKYVQDKDTLTNHFDETVRNVEAQVMFHRRLGRFLDSCINDVEMYEEENKRPKRSRQGGTSTSSTTSSISSLSPHGDDADFLDEKLDCLRERCETSKVFCRVDSRRDVAMLELCCNRLRRFILESQKNRVGNHQDGAVIHINIKKTSHTHAMSSRYSSVCHPLMMRVPSNMTVFQLRKALSKRFERHISNKEELDAAAAPGTGTGIPADSSNSLMNGHRGGDLFSDSLSLTVMRKLPLSYSRKGIHMTHSTPWQLGMVGKDDATEKDESTKSASSFAVPTNDLEKATVCEMVRDHGDVAMDWPPELFDECFNHEEFDTKDEMDDIDPERINAEGEKDADANAPKRNKTISVEDCIQKYCQMEQLEDTEMWYCSKCKKHVRAWKQFHLYRAPPILIIHLKRFHFSAHSHRRKKIDALINFPLTGLDLSKMFSRYNDGEEPVYDCYAVSNHYGGLGGGHYTACTLSDDGTWCHYDDSRLKKDISENEVVSPAAYVLYYRRKDVPVGQDMIFEPIPDASTLQDPVDPVSDPCEVSSHNTDQAGSADAMMDDGSTGSRTISSPMASVEGGHDTFGHDDDLDRDDVPVSETPSTAAILNPPGGNLLPQ